MMTIVWIIVGLAAIFGIGAFIFSDKGDPKERAAEAAGAAAGGAMMGVGCLVQLLLSAIPIDIAILIVLWVLKGCS